MKLRTASKIKVRRPHEEEEEEEEEAVEEEVVEEEEAADQRGQKSTDFEGRKRKKVGTV